MRKYSEPIIQPTVKTQRSASSNNRDNYKKRPSNRSTNIKFIKNWGLKKRRKEDKMN